MLKTNQNRWFWGPGVLKNTKTQWFHAYRWSQIIFLIYKWYFLICRILTFLILAFLIFSFVDGLEDLAIARSHRARIVDDADDACCVVTDPLVGESPGKVVKEIPFFEWKNPFYRSYGKIQKISFICQKYDLGVNNLFKRVQGI